MAERYHYPTLSVVALSLVGLVVLWLPGVASATVIGIDSAVLNPTLDETPEPDPTALAGFTVGSVTYTDIAGGAAGNIGDGTARFYAVNGTDSGSHAAALSGLSATDAVANVSTVDITLAQTVNVGDNVGFFMFEITKAGTSVSPDAVTVKPLDGSGALISTWSFTIATTDYGAHIGEFDVANSNSNIFPAGVVFSIDDFTGGTGQLTGVAGLRFVDDQGGATWDPVAAGTYVVPEPSGVVMLGLMALSGLLVWWRKRVL